jgi:hypothetical protein
VPSAYWRVLNSVPDAPETADEALLAAATDIDCAFASLGPRRALSFGLVPPAAAEPDASPALIVCVGGRREVRIPLRVLRRAVTADVPPVTLIACACAERSSLDDAWEDRPVGTGEPPAESLFRDYRTGPRTSVTRELDYCLGSGIDTVVCGDSASGASEQVAAWAVARGRDQGLIWLNPTDPFDGAETIYDTLLRAEHRDRYLVAVDGVQSNPHVLRRIRDCVEDLRDTYGLKVVLVVTAWPSVVARMAGEFRGLRQINADGAELVGVLLGDARLTADQRDALERLVGTNVHLTVAALEVFAEEGQIPDRVRLQVAATGDTTDEDCQKALYSFGCLGVFEIEVPRRIAERRFKARTIKTLVDHRRLFLSDGAYTLGSRARARLVLERALSEWGAEYRWGGPATVVWEYLNSANEATIVAMLERMDLVGLIDDPDASEVTRYLAMTWDQRTRLVRALAGHYLDGGTWNDCIGAAIFSAQVFAETNNAAAWRAVAEYVRRRFTYLDGPLSVAGTRTADFADFPAIVDSMSIMDDEEGCPDIPGWEAARRIDVDRFYLNWVLGLLLGFEGGALDYDPARTARLIQIAAAEQDPIDGSFYPSRVPWVTARIVLGLCRAGQTYESSPIVKAACDWLRRSRSHGGALETWWRSGTGEWNTDEATTAMGLTALHRAGAPVSAATQTALTWLIGQRSRWRQENHEIDLALVVETLLLYREGPIDRQQGVVALLHWALHVPDGGLPPKDSSIPEDNLRLPFVAAQLNVVIWVTMMRELSAVIDYELRHYRAVNPASTAADPSAGPTPVADTDAPTGDPLPDVDLTAWHRSVDLIRESLASAIAKRQRSRSTPAVARRIDELTLQLDRLNQLGGRVSPRVPVAVLVELDRLGREVCGNRWPEPPMPDR